MKVEKLGEGEPEHAVMYCVHGNEPCGYYAVERLKSQNFEFKKPVKLVFANEEAFEKEERYVDEDLNRVFPGKEDSDVHEENLAYKLSQELNGLKVLDIHSTFSQPEPFAIAPNLNKEGKEIAVNSGVKNAVEIGEIVDDYMEEVNRTAVECGHTGTDQAIKQAYQVLVTFLKNEDIIAEEVNNLENETIFYKIYGKEEGGDFIFLKDNFQKVEKGEKFAEKVNGESRVAEEDFYPVLMSTNGYDDMIGFKAEKVN